MSAAGTMPAAPAASAPARRSGDRRRAFRAGAATVVLVALLVRLAVVLSTPHYVPQTDSADYDRIALSLTLQHKLPDSKLTFTPGPTAFRGPLFPLALSAVYRVVGVLPAGTRWEAGRLLEVALGGLTVALMVLIARRLWGRRIALVAGAIAAVFPPLVLIGSSLMSESLYIPLLLAAVLAALRQRDREGAWVWAALAGVLVALVALTRPNGVAVVIPLAFLVWSRCPRRSWRALRAPAVLLAGALVVLIPWTVRNFHEFGELVPLSTESGFATVGVYNPLTAARTDYPALWEPPITLMTRILPQIRSLNEAQLSDRLNSMAIDYARGHPGYVVKALVWNGLREFALTGTRFELSIAGSEAYPRYLVSLSVYSFWVVGLLALAGAMTAAARRVPWALWGCPLVIVLTAVPLIGSTRYRSPADPFFVMLAALGLGGAVRAIRGRRPRPAAP